MASRGPKPKKFLRSEAGRAKVQYLNNATVSSRMEDLLEEIVLLQANMNISDPFALVDVTSPVMVPEPQPNSYDRFVNLNEIRTINRQFPRGIQKTDYRVVLYKGVVEDGGTATGNDDGEDDLSIPMDMANIFVRIKNERFMLFNDLKDRLQGDLKLLSPFYDMDWKSESQVPSWDDSGNYFANVLEMQLFEASKPGKRSRGTNGYYNRNQAWSQLASVPNPSAGKYSYDPGLRFFDCEPPALGLGGTPLLIFHNLVKEITREDFDAIVLQASNKVNFKCDTATYTEDETIPSGYFLISSHILGFYRTYALRAVINYLQDKGQRQVPRYFPTIEQAAAAHKLLGFDADAGPDEIGGNPGNVSTVTELSAAKTGHAAKPANKTRKPNQAKAVGGTRAVSATDFARTFKWEKIRGSNKDQAEWLHRSAFSYGGFHPTGEEVETWDAQSSQVRKNLIFGTKEANTFMMRPEYSIKRIVGFESRRRENGGMDQTSAFKQLTGTVTTSIESATMSTDNNLPTVPIDPLLNGKPNQKFNGTSASIPAYRPDSRDMIIPEKVIKPPNYGWIKQKGFFWLAPQLEYEFSQKLGIFNRGSNVKITISPFARVIPLKLETEIDKLVEKKLYSEELWTGLKRSNPNGKTGGITNRKSSVNDSNLLLGFSWKPKDNAIKPEGGGGLDDRIEEEKEDDEGNN